MVKYAESHELKDSKKVKKNESSTQRIANLPSSVALAQQLLPQPVVYPLPSTLQSNSMSGQ
jgi:hypothetical protein